MAVLLAPSCGTTDPTNESPGPSRYAAWENGPLANESCFPIEVWLQDAWNAGRYREAGINVYVGLWQGPTEAQLGTLRGAGMKVICHQNKVGLAHLDDRTIIAWMQDNEPENAQAQAEGGYGPSILT